jgi:hypothetical protein
MSKKKTLTFILALGLAVSARAESTLGEIANKTVVHGYITADYQGGKLINDASGKNKITPNFELYRFIIGTQSQLSDTIVFNSELEIEHATRTGVKTSSTMVNTPSGTTSALTKASAGLEIELEQAWVEFRRVPAFQPRVGVILVPMGRLNLNHDADKVDSVDRPLVDRNIIPTTWFEPGVGFTGFLELGDSMEISYQAYVINGLRGSAATAGNESKMRNMRMHKDSSNDNNTDKAVVARLAVSPLQGLEIAASGYTGKYDPASSLKMSMGAIDGNYRWKWLSLQGEWVEVNIERPDPAEVAKRLGQDAGFTSDPGYYSHIQSFAGLRQGWFAQALVRVPAGDFGRFEPFVQMASQDLDKGQETMNDQTRTTLGLNYRPIDNLVVKFNYANTSYEAQYLDASGAKTDVEDKRLMASVAASY